MNHKPNLPEEIDYYSKQYSSRTEYKVNRWMYVAIAISFASDGFFPDQIKNWPAAWRIIIALAPFPFIALWSRDLMHWIRGMDELQRRITQSAMIFAISAVFLVVALWHILIKIGIWKSPRCMDLDSVGFILPLILVFYLRGYFIFNRRYK